MNLLPRFTKLSLVFTGIMLIIFSSCKKENSSTPPPLTTPVALPATNIFPTAFTANWEADAGASSFKLYVASDSLFTNPIAGLNPITVSDDSVNLTGLITNTDYYYRVVAVNILDSSSKPSNVISVHTPNPTDDRFVYIGSADNNFYCFYAGTGRKVWVFPTLGDIESSATINNGVLYFGCTDQRLYAIDPITGVRKWNFLTQGPILTSPATSDDGIFIASNSGFVFGVNKDGSKKWSVQPAGMSTIFSSPAYSNGVVYVGSQDFNLYAYDAETGNMIWSAPTGDTINSSPAISNGIVYVGSSDRYMYAFDAVTGALKWKFPSGDSILSSPTISNGIVYFGSFDGKLYAVDANTGGLKWNLLTGGRIQSSPAVSNGVVFFGSFDNKLYAADATTGSIKWSTTTGGRVMSSPTISNGVVYAGSFDNNLYAFVEATGVIKWKAATGGPIRMASPTVLTYPGAVILPKVSGDVQ